MGALWEAGCSQDTIFALLVQFAIASPTPSQLGETASRSTLFPTRSHWR